MNKIEDIKTDIMLRPVKSFMFRKREKHEGHQGFVQAAEQCSGIIFQLLSINNVLHKDAPVIFTGHSLGGILATMVGYYYFRKKKIHPTIITFGAPAGFNEKLAQEINDQLFHDIFRFGLNEDIVVEMIEDVYCHAGQYIGLPLTRVTKLKRIMRRDYSNIFAAFARHDSLWYDKGVKGMKI